ncbi:hypothetical protein [Rhodococcus sp. 5G237]
MRIVNRSELLTLPAGTLIAEVENTDSYTGTLGQLMIFGGKYSENDFLIRTIDDPYASGSEDSWDRRHDMLENGTSYPVNPYYGREGCFEDDSQKFLVYEAADIASIIAHIAPAMRALDADAHEDR